MRSINFKGYHFTPEMGHEHGKAVLRILLNALVRINCDILRRMPDLPRLYDAGVRYEREPPGQEDWLDTLQLYTDRIGDCEDLACTRVAELIVRDGIRAEPHFTHRVVQREDGTPLNVFHILVRYPDGHIEDPSKILGMNQAQPWNGQQEAEAAGDYGRGLAVLVQGSGPDLSSFDGYTGWTVIGRKD